MGQPEVPQAERTRKIEVATVLAQFYRSEEFLGLNEHTQECYRGDLSRFSIFLKNLDGRKVTQLPQLTCNEVIGFLNLFTSSTAPKKLSAINKFFAYAVKAGLIERDRAPKVKLELTTRETKLLDYLSDEECKNLLAVSSKNPRDIALITIALKTGAGPAEIQSLNTQDVIQINNLGWAMALRFTGGFAHRTILLDEESSHAVKRQLETCQDGEPLFPSRGYDGRLTRVGFWKILKHLGKKIGKDDLTHLTLRDTFIWNFPSDNPWELAEQLGIHVSKAAIYLNRRKITQQTAA